MVHRAASPRVPLPARLGVLLSGRGSNFEALAAACDDGRVPATIAIVLSDVSGAPGLDRARERGIPAVALPRKDFSSREAHEMAIDGALRGAGVDLVCLAGYMRLLSPSFVALRPFGILNIHPSLLPAFPGLEPQAQALRHGVKLSGATVHFVTEGVDEGPIVAQEAVPVEPGDDAGALAARILAVEHRLYPQAVAFVLRGGFEVRGRAVRPLNRG
ncbi:MAG: phosphoribosylglycinamide formyltransferase [Acidobacteria bacterium]|nr:phosphoribosylglycinamide formyltransferase [Acidobacteriota bacterium]